MKKILIIFFCIFIFLFTGFTSVKTDTYTKIENKKKIVKNKNIKNENEVEEEQEIPENTQEEIETGSSSDIQTSEAEYDYSESPVTETYGTYGRLYISGFSVALYDYNVNTTSSSSLQSIVDGWDSAAYYINRGGLVIADHDYQGFSILSSLSEGTTSYIKFEDGSTIGYKLIYKSSGYNTGPDLVDTAGNSFFDMYSDIIMYTCYDGGIMATLWVLS